MSTKTIKVRAAVAVAPDGSYCITADCDAVERWLDVGGEMPEVLCD